jgi:NTP pyrophosphatase (non-canonical NTP hydrolase)
MEKPTMEQLIQKVTQWAQEKDLVKPESVHPQLAKIAEEFGELCGGILKQKPEIIKDSYGDILVTLIISAAQTGYDLIECLNAAYEEIKDRTGKTVDGTFIKESNCN